MILFHPCTRKGEFLKGFRTLRGAKNSARATPEALAAGASHCDVAQVLDRARIVAMWRLEADKWRKMTFISHGGDHGEWR